MSANSSHTAHTEPSDRTWTVSLNGAVIARSAAALLVHEHYNGTALAPVPYLPIGDVMVDLIGPTGHRTHCPVKGDAGYYSPRIEGEDASKLENSIWFYPEPLPPLEPIAGHVAFYGDRFDISSS